MASHAYPGGDVDERDHDDSDRGNNPSEPADPRVIANGEDEEIHEGRNFPSGGGDGQPGHKDGDGSVATGE
jgi:hypothetical protein